MANQPTVADLTPIASQIAQLPPQNNPITNANARARMPAHIQPHLSAIAAHPGLRAIATGGASAAGGNAAMMRQPGQSFDPSALKPDQGSMTRTPTTRHQLVGMTPLVFAGAGSAGGIFTPQTRFKPNRLVIPSVTLAGTSISNMLVGTKPQYAAASTEAFDMYEEQSTAGAWDMDVCEVGQVIGMTVTVTGATTVYSALVGEALDGKTYPIIRSPMKRIATITAAVASGATLAVTLAPQVRFKGRKLICDDTTAKFFIINSVTVGITPQFVGKAGDPVPAATFTEIAQDLWLDLDEAFIGNQIVVNITNIDAGAHAFGVSFMGDVDPRDLVSSY
jgi:hypothetical protein